MAGFKEYLKDIGRRAVGKGPEVTFKKDVENLSANAGIPLSEAQTLVFADRLTNVYHELRLTGVLNSSSDSLRRLDAAVNEMGLDRAAINTASHGSHYRRLGIAPVTSGEYDTIRNFYKNGFNGKTPPHAALHDAALSLKSLESHIVRFAGDARSTKDLAAHLNAPEFAADLGMILRLKDRVVRHETRFEKQLAQEAAAEKLQEATKESLARVFWEAPSDFLKYVQSEWKHNRKKGGVERVANTLVSALGAALVLSSVTAIEVVSKLGWYGARAGYAKLREMNA